MNTLNLKWLAVAAWLISWLLLFWINFAAELSLMMHFFAIPLLLLSTALGAAHFYEVRDDDNSGD